jgi:hypothetical protein
MDDMVHNGRDAMNEQGFTAPQRWVLGLTAAASFIAVMDGMVVTTALDSIRRDLPLRRRCHRQSNDQRGTTPSVRTAILLCTKGEKDDD